MAYDSYQFDDWNNKYKYSQDYQSRNKSADITQPQSEPIRWLNLFGVNFSDISIKNIKLYSTKQWKWYLQELICNYA